MDLTPTTPRKGGRGVVNMSKEGLGELLAEGRTRKSGMDPVKCGASVPLRHDGIESRNTSRARSAVTAVLARLSNLPLLRHASDLSLRWLNPERFLPLFGFHPFRS